ncbi:hypothetical protein C8R46DRAFT_1062381 [Mycena filopes]|nr:hypothetical protein C8R46DRAFT_1062381 [Mycena filopes]
MTEYDYSPTAQAAFQRTQQRISHWADDTAQCAPQYKSPFVPRSDVGAPSFYSPNSPSPRSPPPASARRPTAQRSSSSGHGTATPHGQGQSRAPRRSQTIDVVSPNDSISQASGPSHRSSGGGGGGSRHRARSHSPSRHRSGSGGSRRPTYTVLSPTPAPMQYAAQPQYGYGVQQPAQPAAYVVYPRERRVQVVYPQPAPAPGYYTQYPPAAHPTQTHTGGGLLHKLFSGSGKSGHSRSRSSSSRR